MTVQLRRGLSRIETQCMLKTSVLVRNAWLSAVIQEVILALCHSYRVKLQDGRIVRPHLEHLRRRLATPEQEVPADGMPL